MTKKSLFLMLICAGGMQSNNFCMQTMRNFLPYCSDRPSTRITQQMQAAQRERQRNQLLLCEVPWDQLQAARQELQQNPSALYAAAFNNDLQKTRLLLAAGADINVKDKVYGCTPLYIAALKGHTKVVQLLLQHHKDADINMPIGIRKDTLLHNAVVGAEKEFLQFLLEHHANVNARDIDYRTPLHDAVFMNDLKTSYKASEEMIKLLIQYGADITAQDWSSGETPLHHAQTLDMLKALLPDLFQAPSLKKLCLRRVKALRLSQKKLEVLPKELREAVASKPQPVSVRCALSIQDDENRTVRDRAVENGNQDMVDFIDGVLLKSAKNLIN